MIARNSEIQPIFLGKNAINFPNFVLILFVLCAWEFFNWKLFFSKNIFSFVKKKKKAKPPKKHQQGEKNLICVLVLESSNPAKIFTFHNP